MSLILAKCKYKTSVNVFFFLVSLCLSILMLIGLDGRMGMAMFLVVVILLGNDYLKAGSFSWKKIGKLAIVAVLAIIFILNMDKLTYYIRNGQWQNNTQSNTSGTTNETQEPSDGGDNTVEDTKETATIDDIIYPMYLPVNTYLTNQERVSTEDGERLILTFTGDSSFVLVEETVTYSNTPEIIPTYGDVELIGSSLAVINDNSANWFDNGIEYYVVSDEMDTSELLQVVRSISVLPVSK